MRLLKPALKNIALLLATKLADKSTDYVVRRITQFIDDIMNAKSKNKELPPTTCIRCGGNAIQSKAIGNAYGVPDEAGNSTVFPGQGDLITCLKCSECGHSWVPGKHAFNLGKSEDLGEVKFNDQVPVTINFDHDKVVGMATLSKDEDGNIRASIDFGIPGGDETVEMVVGGVVVEREGVEVKRFTLTSVAIVPKL